MKFLFIGLMLVLLFTIPVTGCSNDTNVQKHLDKEVNLDFEVQYIRTNAFVDGKSYPTVSRISSTEELNAYYIENKDAYDLEKKEVVYSDATIGFLDAIEKYNDDFFKDHVLVFVLLQEGSGSIRHDITDIKRNKSLVDVSVKRNVPQYATDDMAEWHVMVELKRDTYNASEFKIVFE
ncbi:hypothetical protein [Alkalihalobacterium chitinilyticum]|uniref:DUF4825 domain-containing protein n=1 Tax=Alkalihalobacterium chitinilyticum TaxID=2980103 RepID=A0ABT5VFP8_9BACI|nr:hypothetical protein [Alkalihalobacterium chitinilyticum]MDE5414290.1 hypothetical protein [Alkalihalobacterium chitinilyticum]